MFGSIDFKQKVFELFCFRITEYTKSIYTVHTRVCAHAHQCILIHTYACTRVCVCVYISNYFAGINSRQCSLINVNRKLMRFLLKHFQLTVREFWLRGAGRGLEREKN